MTTGAQPETTNGALSHIPGRIPPTQHRDWWVLIGLLLQLAGIGGPAFYVWRKAKHQDVVGKLTVATVKLAWHESLHAKAGVGVLIGGAAVFAVGSVVLARPYAKHWLTLLVAVPIAAVAGALVLGVAALVLALIWVLFITGANVGGGGGGSSKKKDADPQQPPVQPGPGPEPSGQPGGMSF